MLGKLRFGWEIARVTGRIRLDQLSVNGVSRGGVETWFKVRPSGVAFDVGRGAPELAGVEHVFLSHGHLDHASGIPFLLSQRALQGLGSLTVFCPLALQSPLEAFIAAAARVEGRQYEYEIRPLRPGDRVSVGGDMHVAAFETTHVVASLGYHLIQSVRRLRGEFASLSPDALTRLRERGEDVEMREERLLVSYTGDTGSAVFASEPRVLTSRVLILECTFINPEWRESAAQYGHIHIDDLKDRAGSFANELIVLHHLSRRFSLAELRDIVDRELPGLASRVVIFGEAEEGVV